MRLYLGLITVPSLDGLLLMGINGQRLLVRNLFLFPYHIKPRRVLHSLTSIKMAGMLS